VASSCLQLPGWLGLSLMALGRSAQRGPRGRVAARRVASGRHGSDELNLGGDASPVKWRPRWQPRQFLFLGPPLDCAVGSGRAKSP